MCVCGRDLRLNDITTYFEKEEEEEEEEEAKKGGETWSFSPLGVKEK